MSLHRGISISRHKRPSNTNSAEPFPSDIITERFNSWKEVAKQLGAYFEGVADVEATYAKSYLKLANVIETPFKPAHQFLDKGGIQELYELLRAKTHVIAEQHANFSKTIDSTIVKQANKIHNDIKSHVKDIQNDTAKLAATVLKDREGSTQALGELSSSIATASAVNHSTIPVKKDPYIVNAHVRHQMQKQVHDENLHQKSAVIMQKNSEKFEAEIIQSIQSACNTFEELASKKEKAVAETRASLIASFKALSPSLEWNDFCSRKKNVLIDPEAPLRDEEAMKWPQMDEAKTIPLNKGMMQRKKRYTRSYKENYYVVTPAGYLHEYPSSDPSLAFTPEFSLYLPACTLGPQSKDGCKFHIEEGKNSGSSRGFRGTLGMKSDHEWSFKCSNHSEMEAFWDSMKSLCARHLQAIESDSESKEEIKAAVADAGKQPATTEGEPASSPSETSAIASEPPGYTDQKDPGFAGIGAGAQAEKKEKTGTNDSGGGSEGAAAPQGAGDESGAASAPPPEGAKESEITTDKAPEEPSAPAAEGAAATTSDASAKP